MYQLFFTPEWFRGFDLLFDSVALVVALLIAAYSYRVYRLTQENKYRYFSLAFVLVTLGMFAKIGTYSILYYQPIRDTALAVVGPAAGVGLSLTRLWYRGAFFVQMLLMLSAWLLLFFISQKSRARLRRFYEVSQIALFLYLILLISVVSNLKYVVFYLTSAVILGMTTLHFYKNYLSNQKKSSYLVMSSFLILTLAHIVYAFVYIYEPIYALGEVLLLVSFLMLLYVYMRSVK